MRVPGLGGSPQGRSARPESSPPVPWGRRALLLRAALPWPSAVVPGKVPHLSSWLPCRSLPLRPPSKVAALWCWRSAILAAGGLPPRPRPVAAGPSGIGDAAGPRCPQSLRAPGDSGCARGRACRERGGLSCCGSGAGPRTGSGGRWGRTGRSARAAGPRRCILHAGPG